MPATPTFEGGRGAAGEAPVAAREPRRPRSRRGILPGLILIALGLAFLAGNYFHLGGGTLFLALGLALLVARFATGNYGYAVPAGILLGFGSYVALEEVRALPPDGGGWFFILVGLGFLAVYVIGLRPREVWPLFPAAVALALGVLLARLVEITILAQFAWLARYWPVVLVVIGLWLLLRDRLPRPLQRPIATIGAVALILYVLLAVASSAAREAGPDARAFPSLRLALPRLTALRTETTSLAAPIGPGQTFRVVNPVGRTVIRAVAGEQARITATEHLWSSDQHLDVRLTPTSEGLRLEAAAVGGAWFGASPSVDYVVELPPEVLVDVHGGSGDLEITGMAGAVTVEATSGEVVLREIEGGATVRTTSGDQHLANVRGELRLESISGAIEAQGVTGLREARTSSGAIFLDGRFAGDARVETSSGEVEIRFAPESSVAVDVLTSSGSVAYEGLALDNLQAGRRTLSGSMGGGNGLLQIRASSGDVTLRGM